MEDWGNLFLLAVGIGFFISSILFAKHKHNFPIALIVAIFSIILIHYTLYWTQKLSVFPYLTLFPEFGNYMIGPLFYAYIYRFKKGGYPPKLIAHFLPALLILALLPIYWMARSGLFADGTFSWSRPLFWTVNPWVVNCHLSLYFALTLQLCFRQTTQSVSQTLLYRWMRLLTACFGLYILGLVSYYVLVNFSFFNLQWDYAISVIMSLSIYAIGFFAFNQPEIFNGELLAALFTPGKESKTNHTVDKLEEGFYLRLLHIMESEKPFLDSELRLATLADQVSLSIHQLSALINEKAGMNFNQFINEYRLEEAKVLLCEAQESSIKTIYYQVGFSGKATFYNAFRKKFDCTPTEYRKLALQKDSSPQST